MRGDSVHDALRGMVWGTAVGIGGYAVYVLALVLLHACATHSEPAVRTALSVLADVIDPAYELAMDGCAARDTALVAEARAGTRPLEDAERARAALGDRCRALVEQFEWARATHDRARALVEQGGLEEADQLAREIRDQLRALAPPPWTASPGDDAGGA